MPKKQAVIDYRDNNEFRFRPFASALMGGGSPVVECKVDFVPDYWVVVAHVTGGVVNVYPGIGISGYPIRLLVNVLRLPISNQAITVAATLATGYFEAYAVKGAGFEIR